MPPPSIKRFTSLHAARPRVIGIGLVFVLALGAFASGVGTSGIPDIDAESLIAWLYFSGGLFVFGGLDLGSPQGEQ